MEIHLVNETESFMDFSIQSVSVLRTALAAQVLSCLAREVLLPELEWQSECRKRSNLERRN